MMVARFTSTELRQMYKLHKRGVVTRHELLCYWREYKYWKNKQVPETGVVVVFN